MKPLPYHLQPLTVALRVRPMNHSEIRTGARIAAQTVDQNLVVLMDPNDDSDDILRANRSREKKFYFDVTFSELSSQEAVYKATVLDRDIIGRVVSGYNCTVFAYGATGAGKTYTMLGTEREPGLMVLTLNSLFTKIQDTSDDMIYRVTMAYMEIYNEMIRDLLNPSSGILDLFEDSNGEIVVSGLLEVETSCTIEVMTLLRRGNLRRTVEPTAANKTSSRSHAILKVTVEQRDRAMNVSQEVRTGVLFMVDLAGSERAAVTQNRGKRMVEGAHINRSLLALANCINALGSNHTHYVNYRDSKLTRLLKDALGGNCKTIMIAHVSPASTSFEESRNTLAYAERGKKIKNKTRQNVVDVNYHITQYHYIIKELRQKIAHLQSQLERQQLQQAPTTTSTAGGGLLVGSSLSAITLSGGELATEAGGYYGGNGETARIAELCALLKTTSQDEKEIRQELFSIECQLLQNALEYQKHSACIQEWQRKRASTDSITKDSQDLHVLSPSASHDSHVTQQPLPPVTSHDSHMIQEDSTTVSSTNKLSIMTRPQQLVTTAADELHSISPDSGTDIGPSRNHGNDSGNHDDVVMEPEEVSTAREEVATLVAEKQRLEALHRRLDRLLVESKTKMAETKQALSSIPGLLPIRKEFIELLQHSHELEAASIEHNLAATLISLQLGRHESSIEQLLQHSRELMELVAHQRELIKGQGVDLPPELTRRCSELRERQEMLTVQVAAERQLPVIASSGTQLPAIARLSAKLYNNMTGSKSNLFIDDTVTEPDETVTALSDVHLPLLESPRDDQPPQLQRERDPAHGLLSPGTVSLPPLVRAEASSTTKVSQATKKQELKKDHSSSISLPPIDTSATPSLVGAKQFSDVSGNSEANSRIGGTEPEEKGEAKDEFSSHVLSKKSDTALIVEAAKRARQNLIAGIPSPKKVLTKMTSFTTPRMSVSRNSTNKSKYIVAASKTSVIDIEGVGEVPSQQRHDSIPCDQSRSHPHLGNSTPSKVLSPTRMKNSTKGNSVSFNKSVLSEATLRRVREGRTIITIDELEKITNRRTTHKSSSTHNTPLHQKHVQSPHHRLAGHSSTSLSKVTTAGQNASSSKFSHKSSPLRTKAAAGAGALHSNRPGGVRTGRHGPIGVTPGAVMRGGRKVNVRRTLPHPPTIRGRHSPMPRRQLIPSKVTAGNQLSKINSPYLTPVKLPKKQGTRDQAKKTKEWIN